MAARQYDLCRGAHCTPEQSEQYRALYDAEAEGRSLEQLPSVTIPDGPGTELVRIFAALGVQADERCGCKAYAARMNAWGVAGCRERRAEIVTWLSKAAKELDWRAKLKAAAKAAGRRFFTIRGIVSEAIRRAEVAAAGPEEV